MHITILSTFTDLTAVAAFALVMAGVGNSFFLWANFLQDDPLERFLSSIAFGIVFFELGTFLLAVLNILRQGIWALLAICVLLAAVDFAPLVKLIVELLQKFHNGSKTTKLVQVAFWAVVFYAALAASAPLTGSDALHYHFTEPRLILENGYRPNFFSTHSFLLGQGHLLILAGLALGSDKFAMALLFLGGILAALSGGCLARRWMPASGAWLVALCFAVSPVVFWQMSIAGAPDLWMTFYVTMAVLLVARAKQNNSLPAALLAGIFAGSIAGTKYTGALLAAVLGVALVRETRSLKFASSFGVAALGTGIWPYLRNFFWTGDPVFPFLLPRLHLQLVNEFALAALLADTHAVGKRSLFDVLRFPLFAAIDLKNIGVWQFLGPVVFALIPLGFFAYREHAKTPLWRIVLTVWFLGTFAIGLTSGLVRFTIPVFPLGLVVVMAGLYAIPRTGWSLVRHVALATIVMFLGLSAGGVFLYGHAAVQAALGIISRDAYLSATAPDYGRVQFVNNTLKEKAAQGNVLVFFRHLYYLQVGFREGNPADSWAIDPTKLQDATAWHDLFQRNQIRWIVKAPTYPKSLAESLRNLEAQGLLVPIAEREVDDFYGNRLNGRRTTSKVTILEVR